MKRLLACMVCLLLSSCGFHFRDNEAVVNPQIKTVYIQDDTNSRTGLIFVLRQNLQAIGVHTVDKPKNADETLRILSDSFTQSTSPLGIAQQLNAQTLSYSVKISLSHKQPTTLSTQLTFWQNANQILGDTNAIQPLKQNMIRDMSQKILAYMRANEKNEKNEA